MTLGKVDNLATTQVLDLGLSQHVVQLGDEFLDSGNELNQTLGNDDSTEVVAISSTLAHHVCNIGHDVVQALLLGFYLLRDETDVRLSLQGTLQCNVRSRAAHHLDEVPVLTGRIAVTLNVTNQL